jgi:hypothetical protein
MGARDKKKGIRARDYGARDKSDYFAFYYR